MSSFNNRARMLVASILLATPACGGNAAVPTGDSNPSPDFVRTTSAVGLTDTTSILKKLTKDVEIGSTVDSKNGDTGPRAISLVRSTFGLDKGQLLVCNFDDSAGTAGKGTTIEVFDPKPHSKPRTFTQSAKIAGCDGDAVTATNQVYGAGMVSGITAQFDQSGKFENRYGPPIEEPLADGDAFCGEAYAPEDIYVSDAKTGAIIKLAKPPVSGGRATETQVIAGFAVNSGSGWSVLGPSGIQYNATRTGRLATIRYIWWMASITPSLRFPMPASS